MVAHVLVLLQTGQHLLGLVPVVNHTLQKHRERQKSFLWAARQTEAHLEHAWLKSRVSFYFLHLFNRLQVHDTATDVVQAFNIFIIMKDAIERALPNLASLHAL